MVTQLLGEFPKRAPGILYCSDPGKLDPGGGGGRLQRAPEMEKCHRRRCPLHEISHRDSSTGSVIIIIIIISQ